MRILVVEDDPDGREALEANLVDSGYTVAVAGTVSDALRSAHDCIPDLVLLDLMLPDGPGEDLYRVWRANPRMRSVAVIIVSARSREADRVAGLELGADDYVSKPFSMRLLLLRIEAVLKRTRLARAAAAAAEFQPERALTTTERTTS